MNDMASSLFRNTLTPLVAVTILTASAEAQVSYTNAAGYNQVTVPGGTLGAVSATLQNKSDHTSNADINNDWVPLDNQGTPNTADDVPAQQTITVTGAGWTDSQWISPDSYLCYVQDSVGGEEAFLILGNTADTITIQVDFNLLDAARSIPTTTSISIRKAQTVASLFGTGAETDFATTDKVYLWNGSSWTTYRHDGTSWRRTNTFSPVDTDVIFPDEGMFIQRNDPTDLTLTFFGDVPGKAQVTTMAGPGLQFVSTRYPVETTIGQLGFENLPNWQTGRSGDLVYLWTGSGWLTYWNNGPDNWGRTNSFSNVATDVVPADAAVFVSRKGASTLEESANFHALPYTP